MAFAPPVLAARPLSVRVGTSTSGVRTPPSVLPCSSVPGAFAPFELDGRVLVVSGAENCPTCVSPTGSHAGIALIPEIYNPQTNAWTQLNSASLSLPLYPHMFVLPDGRVFASSTQEDPIVSRVLDIGTQTWSTVGVLRDGGSSVQYRLGKILKTGSARNPDYPPAASTSTAWVIDMNLPSPTWRSVTSVCEPTMR